MPIGRHGLSDLHLRLDTSGKSFVTQLETFLLF